MSTFLVLYSPLGIFTSHLSFILLFINLSLLFCYSSIFLLYLPLLFVISCYLIYTFRYIFTFLLCSMVLIYLLPLWCFIINTANMDYISLRNPYLFLIQKIWKYDCNKIGIKIYVKKMKNSQVNSLYKYLYCPVN